MCFYRPFRSFIMDTLEDKHDRIDDLEDGCGLGCDRRACPQPCVQSGVESARARVVARLFCPRTIGREPCEISWETVMAEEPSLAALLARIERMAVWPRKKPVGGIRSIRLVLSARVRIARAFRPCCASCDESMRFRRPWGLADRTSKDPVGAAGADRSVRSLVTTAVRDEADQPSMRLRMSMEAISARACSRSARPMHESRAWMRRCSWPCVDAAPRESRRWGLVFHPCVKGDRACGGRPFVNRRGCRRRPLFGQRGFKRPPMPLRGPAFRASVLDRVPRPGPG
jgi:hypothetical protein